VPPTSSVYLPILCVSARVSRCLETPRYRLESNRSEIAVTIIMTSSQNAGPMAQGPAPTSPSLSHDWAGDQNGTSSLSYTSSTQPLTQARTEQSNNSTDRTSSSLTRSRSIIGLHPNAPIDEEHDHGPASELLWSRIRVVLREPFAEFWGVVIMVMFGDGSVAQVLLSTGQTTAPGGNGYGSYQSINWG
jgi:aquaglyceroporin related protein